MGDKKHGLFWEGYKEPVVEFALGLFVERTTDFVEQEDVAGVQQTAGVRQHFLSVAAAHRQQIPRGWSRR